MGRKRKHSAKASNSLLSQYQYNEVRRRAKLITDALDTENDDKVEEIAIESIKRMTPEELLFLGDMVQKHGFYEVGDAIIQGDQEFFGGTNEE